MTLRNSVRMRTKMKTPHKSSARDPERKVHASL
jgi:hypothetical protein